MTQAMYIKFLYTAVELQFLKLGYWDMIYILKKVTHYTIQFYDFLTGTKRYDDHTIMIVSIASKISLIPISQLPSSVLTDLLSVYCFYFSRMSFKWNQTCIDFLTWFTSLSIEHMRFIYVVSVCIYELFMSFLFYFILLTTISLCGYITVYSPIGGHLDYF